MQVINVEIKAACQDQHRIRNILNKLDADFRGRDHQVDIYFNSGNGRLKLRQGNIENNLIFYERPDNEGPKTSHCLLYKTEPATVLKDILGKAMGVKTTVEKQREIYFIGNIKIHLDEVTGLGDFVEIEARGTGDEYSEDYLLGQCRELMKDLGIQDGDLVKDSYGDMNPG